MRGMGGLLFAAALAGSVAWQANAAPLDPGSVLANKERGANVKEGQGKISQKIGPFSSPAQVFLTALGTAQGLNAGVSFTVSLSFSDIVHASNGDNYVAPNTSAKLAATANFDFFLEAGQTATVDATETWFPVANAKKGKLKLFYRAIAVKCISAC